MSLVRIAARIALVQALKDRTQVGANVHDSLIGGIEADENGRLNIGNGERRLFMVIYTDTAKSSGGDFRAMHEGADTDIVFEWGIAAGMVATDDAGAPLTDPETGETQIVAGIPDTDANFEFMLDMIGRQAIDALNDPANEWADIWRDIASGGITSIERQRAASGSTGQRMAAHQMRVSAKLMDEPVRGADIPHPLPRLFGLLDGSDDSELAAKSALMQAALSGSDEPWIAAQRRLGLSATEIEALGLAPLAVTDQGEAPALQTGTLDVDGQGETDVSQ